MNPLNDITQLAIEELIDNAFKSLDVNAIYDVKKQKEKVLGMIAKIPDKDVLVIAKENGKIILLVQGKKDIQFINSKPTRVNLQDIIESKFDDLTKG